MLLDSVHTAGIASSKVQNVRAKDGYNRIPRYLTNKTQLLKVELLGRASVIDGTIARKLKGDAQWPDRSFLEQAENLALS